MDFYDALSLIAGRLLESPLAADILAAIEKHKGEHERLVANATAAPAATDKEQK